MPTETRTPAETLRAAADRLTELAAETSPHPWEPIENYTDSWVVRDAARDGLATESDSGDITGPDAAWIAALGPQVAVPLSAWLRYAARLADCMAADFVDPTEPVAVQQVEFMSQHALAVARCVLGETPTPDNRED